LQNKLHPRPLLLGGVLKEPANFDNDD
jgi:hypothetical protein